MLYRHVFDKISTEFCSIFRVFVNFAGFRGFTWISWLRNCMKYQKHCITVSRACQDNYSKRVSLTSHEEVFSLNSFMGFCLMGVLFAMFEECWMGKICHLVRHRDPLIQVSLIKVRLDLRTCSSMTHFKCFICRDWISSFKTHNLLIREHTVNWSCMKYQWL